MYILERIFYTILFIILFPFLMLFLLVGSIIVLIQEKISKKKYMPTEAEKNCPYYIDIADEYPHSSKDRIEEYESSD